MTKETRSYSDWRREFDELGAKIYEAHTGPLHMRDERDRLQKRRAQIADILWPEGGDDIVPRGPGEPARGFGGHEM